jgi:hypothetical protein
VATSHSPQSGVAIIALDLQFGFWHIQMAPKDMKKTTLIIKIGLYD